MVGFGFGNFGSGFSPKPPGPSDNPFFISGANVPNVAAGRGNTIADILGRAITGAPAQRANEKGVARASVKASIPIEMMAASVGAVLNTNAANLSNPISIAAVRSAVSNVSNPPAAGGPPGAVPGVPSNLQ